MAIQIYSRDQIYYWNSKSFYEKATPKDITNCLQAGADLNACLDTEESTPLHLAARHSEDSAVINALLNAGADPNVRDKHSATPLHIAAMKNENPAVIAALLNAGASPNADNRYTPPLHCAAWYNRNPAVINVLLNAGADPNTPNARDRQNRTPLHLAVQYSQNSAVITALLDAGADPSARTKDGKIPGDFAKENKALKASDVYERLKARSW